MSERQALLDEVGRITGMPELAEDYGELDNAALANAVQQLRDDAAGEARHGRLGHAARTEALFGMTPDAGPDG